MWIKRPKTVPRGIPVQRTWSKSSVSVVWDIGDKTSRDAGRQMRQHFRGVASAHCRRRHPANFSPGAVLLLQPVDTSKQICEVEVVI